MPVAPATGVDHLAALPCALSAGPMTLQTIVHGGATVVGFISSCRCGWSAAIRADTERLSAGREDAPVCSAGARFQRLSRWKAVPFDAATPVARFGCGREWALLSCTSPAVVAANRTNANFPHGAHIGDSRRRAASTAAGSRLSPRFATRGSSATISGLMEANS